MTGSTIANYSTRWTALEYQCKTKNDCLFLVQEQKLSDKMTNIKTRNNLQSKVSYSYQEAVEASTEYFNGDDLAARVFVDKYALRDGEDNLLEKTPEDMHRRIAKEFARVEQRKFKDSAYTEEEIFQALDRFRRIVPQGSPMYGIGNPYQVISLSNCYVLQSPQDSYAGICRADEELVQISKRRGGCGIDLETLRPEGSVTKNAARTSTGTISFAERFSNSIREVGQNGRRGALMLTQSIHHPDVNKFIACKRDLTKITGANISVRLTDEFLNAVEAGGTYEQRWGDKVSQQVDARGTWNQLVEAAHATAEPGMLMWDNILKESIPDCYADQGFKTVCTNPCSEIPLSAYDSCRLMLLNTYEYVNNPFTDSAKFDFDRFYNDAYMLQRLMDDMVDLELECIDRIIDKVNKDPEADSLKSRERDLWVKVREAAFNGRRTGSGMTAIGDMVAALGVKYGSKEGIKVIDDVYREFKLACYSASVDMAKELGPFPIWNFEKEKDNPFLRRIESESPDLWKDMKKYGRRNIALLTTAPCGSVSILTQTSSGIEPQFMIQPYTRRKKGNPGDNNFRSDFVDQNGDHWMEFEVYPAKVKEWMKATGESDLSKSPWHGCTAPELDWESRVTLQATAQRHIDHAISSTVNLPNDVSVEAVNNIYLAAWKSGCKGMTIYRDGCRTGVLVAKEDDKKSKDSAVTHKRPAVLPCEVHHNTVGGVPYFVLISLKDSTPYEVFAGVNKSDEEEPIIPKRFKAGTLTKMDRGHYKGQFIDDKNAGETLSLNKLGNLVSSEEGAITRLISTALRHGVELHYLVHQLEKVKGDMFSFSKTVARALKKYIPDGTVVKGEKCANCESEALVRQEGCVTCKSCGSSKCG
jgi:ribonucleoside-diphosphate reductase alpha chain